MIRQDNLIIIGTSHIAKQSLEEVKRVIEEEKPEIVALELDKKRAYALMSKKKEKVSFYNIFRVGLNGFIFSLIGAWAEKKLGEMVGVSPGDEMKTAIKLARKNNIKIAFVDQDIEITLRRFSKLFGWKDKWNLIADIIKALIFRKKEFDFDLNTVPDEKTIQKMIGKVKDRYPNLYKVLIEERNSVIADNLNKILSLNPEKRVIAVIGAGHEKEVLSMIKRQDISYSFSIG